MKCHDFSIKFKAVVEISIKLNREGMENLQVSYFLRNLILILIVTKLSHKVYVTHASIFYLYQVSLKGLYIISCRGAINFTESFLYKLILQYLFYTSRNPLDNNMR